MSIKNRKVNRLRASEESSDPKENAYALPSKQVKRSSRSDLSSECSQSAPEEQEEASQFTKVSEAGKVSRLAANNLPKGDQNDSNVPNSKRNRFISIALVCLNIAIFIVLFGVLLMVLKFAFAKIRLFFSEHVAAN